MDGITAYKESTITTQSRGHLIVMLYEGAVKFLNQAIEQIEAGDDGSIADRAEYITKATNIINELNAILDVEAGGEIAVDLRRLYQFMIRHLLQANIRNDTRMMREVIDLLEDLNEGWKAISI